MGLNISGLVINKNYNNEIEQIEAILGEKLSFVKELSFEEASENWKEDEYCDIYFSEEGTFIFTAMERGGFEFNIKNQEAFSFVLSEMSMTFAVNYTDNGNMVRSFIETEEGERHQNTGEKLTFEETENDASELIYHLIESTLGKPFWDIDLEEKCMRYSFKAEAVEIKKNVVENKQPTPEPQPTIPTPQPEIIEKVASKPTTQDKKPWWKFW